MPVSILFRVLVPVSVPDSKFACVCQCVCVRERGRERERERESGAATNRTSTLDAFSSTEII